jgi:uracil phosphoribosyltransferase
MEGRRCKLRATEPYFSNSDEKEIKMKKATTKKVSKKMPTQKTAKVTVLKHPMLQHKLTLLRDKNISSMVFRQLVEEMSLMLVYEATRDLKVSLVGVSTPLENTKSPKISDSITLVAILRAGLGMLNGMMRVLPFATVGHIGIYKDRFVQATVEYYLRLPRMSKDQKVFLVDPMLATGDTACAAVDRLKEYGVKHIRLITLLAAPEGVAKLNQSHPDVEIFTASLERGLNKKGYILPGVGDAGDRLFDTIQHS